MPTTTENSPAHGLTATLEHRGRPRKYANAAERSRAYRARVREKKAAWEALGAAGATAAPPLALGPDRTAAAIQFLDSLLDGDEQKQRKAWEDLEEVLGENRPSYRKLFP